MKNIFFVLFALAAINLTAQNKKSNTIHPSVDLSNKLATDIQANLDYFAFDGAYNGFLVKIGDPEGLVPPFYIDAVPICNVHYRNFLDWHGRVFEAEKIAWQNLYPDTSFWLKQFPNQEIGDILKDNYFHHPAFDYYPVVGITWAQAQAFALWRSDRVNEHILMYRDFLAIDRESQRCEAHFSTRNYFNKLYEGTPGRKPLKIKETGEERMVWPSDNILLPTHRLPTAVELAAAATSDKKYIHNSHWQKFKNIILAHNKKHPIPEYYNHKIYHLPHCVIATQDKNTTFFTDNHLAEWLQNEATTNEDFNFIGTPKTDTTRLFMPIWWRLANGSADAQAVRSFDSQHTTSKNSPYIGFRCVLPNF